MNTFILALETYIIKCFNAGYYEYQIMCKSSRGTLCGCVYTSSYYTYTSRTRRRRRRNEPKTSAMGGEGENRRGAKSLYAIFTFLFLLARAPVGFFPEPGRRGGVEYIRRAVSRLRLGTINVHLCKPERKTSVQGVHLYTCSLDWIYTE